jgi:uncharacterized membrane protein
MLIASAAVFLAIHFVVSGTKLRDAIVSVTGERAYLGLFSLASIGTIVWLVMSYNAAEAGPDNRLLCDLGRGVTDSAIILVGLAFFLGVQGLLIANPTAVGQEGASAAAPIKGVLRITRHPFLWGATVWAAVHLLANGDLASVIFFGTFLALSFFGTFSIDAKRARKAGAAWREFEAKTSNLPFAAIAAGRNTFSLRETLGWRFLVAAALFVAVLFAHARIFHASPFPDGWVPF